MRILQAVANLTHYPLPSPFSGVDVADHVHLMLAWTDAWHCVCNTHDSRLLTVHANLKEDKAGGRDWSSAFSIRLPPPAQFMAVERQQLPDWPCNGI